MDFFCYHRDRADSLALRLELLEDHWSYMDRFAQEMIARGPTFEGEDEVPTGSVHILTLSDPAAARTFAFEEPGYQAGVYRDVMLRRWRNDIGRTMWEFTGGAPDGDGYLVLGLGAARPVAEVPGVPDDPDAKGLIAFGPLLSDDGEKWLGTIAMLRASSPDEAREVLSGGDYADIEVHQWRFGGHS